MSRAAYILRLTSLQWETGTWNSKPNKPLSPPNCFCQRFVTETETGIICKAFFSKEHGLRSQRCELTKNLETDSCLNLTSSFIPFDIYSFSLESLIEFSGCSLSLCSSVGKIYPKTMTVEDLFVPTSSSLQGGVLGKIPLFKARHKGRWSWCWGLWTKVPLRGLQSIQVTLTAWWRWRSFWLPPPDTPEEKLLLPFWEMLAMGITDKAEPWDPALAMCILCCHGGKGNSCKSLSCFSIKEGGLVLTLPDPDLSVKSKLALNDAFLFAYSNNMEHLSCAIDGWHTQALKGD